ncbi:small ribosomal subunit protein uS19-like [Callorhinus ursinus]|uniref:small ribosomal subunit protein uS19-like n=1 Tax=Callorhinus ursinus TaxID=34884 RepID=UPI003CD00697
MYRKTNIFKTQTRQDGRSKAEDVNRLQAHLTRVDLRGLLDRPKSSGCICTAPRRRRLNHARRRTRSPPERLRKAKKAAQPREMRHVVKRRLRDVIFALELVDSVVGVYSRLSAGRKSSLRCSAASW